jgi:Tfp pilus assembly protein PilO
LKWKAAWSEIRMPAMKPFWQRVGERERLVGMSLLLLLGLALIVKLAYVPWTGRLSQRRVRLAELRAQAAVAESVISRLGEEQRALDEARRRSQALERRVSAQLSLPRILDALGAQAQDQQVTLGVLQPREHEQADEPVSLAPGLRLRQRALTLELEGTYRHIGEFLGRLSSAPFLASVRSVAITRPEEAGMPLQATVALAVYLPEASAP